MCPANVKLRKWDAGIVPVWESNWVVIFGRLQSFRADWTVVYSTGSPRVPVLVQPIHPRLRREFDFPDHSRRRLNLLDARPNGRLEIVNDCFASTHFDQLANSIGAGFNLNKRSRSKRGIAHSFLTKGSSRWRVRRPPDCGRA
jgi:hypothetical protein